MTCFSLFTIERLLIWLVVVGGIVALIRLLVPVVVGPLGPFGNVIVQALYIVLWVVVAIAIIVLIFELLACVVPVRLP